MEGLAAVDVERLEQGPGGVGMPTEVSGDPGRGPPGIGERDRFQAVPGSGCQFGSSEVPELGAGRLVEMDADHGE